MKKIIALALALIMVLSMGVVALAKTETPAPDKQLIMEGPSVDANGKFVNYATAAYAAKPGDAIEFVLPAWDHDGVIKGYKIAATDFTTDELCGASLIDDVVITKEKNAIRLTIDESYTMALETPKAVKGVIKFLNADKVDYYLYVNLTVNNEVIEIAGAKKAADAEPIKALKNTVQVMDEDGGYVTFSEDVLAGTVKMAAEEKVYFNMGVAAADKEAVLEALGEDYEGNVEMYGFETKAFEDVAFTYDAYEEDPHFFYAWDGEKFTAIEAKFNADEDVEKYEFTADAEGIIVVTDVEIVLAAEETKNPDTGANDVVGVAAALAVVSLVAAGAVSLKK